MGMYSYINGFVKSITLSRAWLIVIAPTNLDSYFMIKGNKLSNILTKIPIARSAD